jgi:peptide/nickel transport system permease protein
MSATYGNWGEIAAYYETTKKLYAVVYKTEKDSTNAENLIVLKNEVNELGKMYNEQGITQSLKNINQAAETNPSFTAILPYAKQSLEAFNKVNTNATSWKNYIPSISWYGFNNQYHNWISNFFRGNFGISYQDDRPIKDKIYDALGWTMLLNFLAIILTYLISIPLGVFSAVKKGSQRDKISTTLLFMLYSLPNFWIATMLIVFFCNPDFFAWFPTYGTGEQGNWLDIAYHLILPLFCIIYPSFAFLSRQMRGGMLTVLGQDYIRTAKAKGLSQKNIIWKHAIRNSLLPMITLFASIFPLAISGSFAIEFIFNLPGMGQLSLNAIYARDYPMVFTVMMFSTILTLIGYLVSDILYAFVDPRISFSKK